MNTVELIKTSIDGMTKSERQVASFFLGHQKDFAFLTLDKISEQIGTSTTSVLRFCRKLGYVGYKDMQEALRSEMKHQPELTDKLRRTANTVVSESDELFMQTLQQDIRCINNTFFDIPLESIAASLKYFSEAKRVFTFGMKEAYALAHYAYTRLLSVRENVFMLNAGYNSEIESVLGLTEEDTVAVFMFHRYTRQAQQLLPLLRRRGAKVILVTSAPFDQVENECDALLPCRIDANGVKNTYAAPVCLCDFFCNALAVKNGERTLAYIKECEDIIKTGSVFGS